MKNNILEGRRYVQAKSRWFCINSHVRRDSDSLFRSTTHSVHPLIEYLKRQNNIIDLQQSFHISLAHSPARLAGPLYHSPAFRRWSEIPYQLQAKHIHNNNIYMRVKWKSRKRQTHQPCHNWDKSKRNFITKTAILRRSIIMCLVRIARRNGKYSSSKLILYWFCVEFIYVWLCVSQPRQRLAYVIIISSIFPSNHVNEQESLNIGPTYADWDEKCPIFN